MLNKLNELTPDQVAALMATVRDEWVGHGLSTQPADRAAAEVGVMLAYREAGLKPPKQIIWEDSPMAGCLAAQSEGADWESVREQVWGQMWLRVCTRVRDGRTAWSPVWEEFYVSAWDKVGGPVWLDIWRQVSSEVRTPLNLSLFGQHDAGYCAWIDFYSRVGVHDHGAGFMQVAQSCGWWWASGETVILTERPTELHLDKEGRLHREDGPAIQYPDGWGVHAVHGVPKEEQC